MARSTPIRMGLFSIVTLIADRLQTSRGVPVRVSAWDAKHQPTFRDVLALVGARLGQHQSFSRSVETTEVVNIPAALLKQLTETLCYAA